MIGLKQNINILVPYDSEWDSLYEIEKCSIRSVLSSFTFYIEHIGSTSVKGLKSKPIIDIIIGIDNISDWVNYKIPLESIGYDYAENAGVPNHYIFGRDKNIRTHLIHLVKYNGYSWKFNIQFRNILRTDIDIRNEYIKCKESSVNEAPYSRSKYNELKSKFFEEYKTVIEKAK
jgi:GrpB-like predicted nucleotidyltransferase (UPF0157 family)